MTAATGRTLPLQPRPFTRGINLIRPLLPGVLLVAIWEAAANFLFDPRFFGQPSDIIVSFVQHAVKPQIWHHTWVTLSEILLGYTLGVAIGGLLGYLLGMRDELARVFDPYILLLNAIPKVAIAPLLIVIFGIGMASKVAIITSLVMFLIYYGVFVGIRGIDADFIYQARIMGASRIEEVRHVILPAILPNVLVALKQSAVYAVIGAVIGEFIAAQAGLGYFILDASGTYNVTDIWVGVTYLMILLFSITGLIGLVERRFMKWMPRKSIR